MAEGHVSNNNGLATFLRSLGQPDHPPLEDFTSPLPLDDVAFHDFAFYEFLLDLPDRRLNLQAQLSDAAVAYLDYLETTGIAANGLDFLATLLEQLENAIRQAAEAGRWVRGLTDDEVEWFVNNFVGELYTNFVDFLEWLLSVAMIDVHNASSWLYEHILAIMQMFESPGTLYADFVLRSLRFNIGSPSPTVEQALAPHPFETFARNAVNVGLRVVYRQYWRPMGVQTGEIVKTIPLGPGETRKVSYKIVRRQKRVSTLDSVRESESTSEQSDSTKDSSEIVAEWSKDRTEAGKVGASAGFLGFGASSEYSDSTTTKNSSKDTASHLSEAMQKTASKMRQETKVTVSTEQEATFEQESAAEIKNPNNEVPLTYVYHKIQQQYEVRTVLAEVRGVIFVPETVPLPAEINEAWVRRHDWIIAEALRDESFRQSLNELIQEAEEGSLLTDPTKDPFENAVEEAKSKFAQFEHVGPGGPSNGGLSIPDIYGEPLRRYYEYRRDQSARERANALRRVKRERLFQHIRDNILHYCRAIWTREDPDQRLLRYKKEGRVVPVEWRSAEPFRLLRVGDPPPSGPYEPIGYKPLYDVIDPTGPVGYVGNFAVYDVRPTGQAWRAVLPEQEEPVFGELVPTVRMTEDGYWVVNLSVVLAMMRAKYADPQKPWKLRDPALDAFVDEVDRYYPAGNLLTLDLDDDEVREFVSLLPRANADKKLIDDNGLVIRDSQRRISQIKREDWIEYLYCRNGTRRFLVDSNNLYLSLFTGAGAALEPFKRAHRYLDVLKVAEELETMKAKNKMRDNLADRPHRFDPDIDKVVIVDGAVRGLAEAIAGNESSHIGGVGSPSTSAPSRTVTDEAVSAPG
ncbi:MAG: hypothetical protein FLDDKLPJ_01657 [Phycisphaerae bacterium]|nr:hypothetical protein [Phycisphaerae bacterium]